MESTVVPRKGIKPSSSKAKGRNFQKYAVSQFLSLHPELTEDDVRSCPMGSHGADLQLSQAAKKLAPYEIECKARAKVSLIYDAIEQAKTQGPLTPIAFIKADRKAPLVVMTAEHFFELQRLVKGAR